MSRTPIPASDLDARVLALTLFPGVDTGMVARNVQASAEAGVLRAVLIRGFGVGNVPIDGLSDLRPLLANATGNGLEIVISSQCYRGHTDLSMYPGGRALVDAGAIAARDMTFEAAITKTMWSLAQPEKSLRAWFETNWQAKSASADQPPRRPLRQFSIGSNSHPIV